MQIQINADQLLTVNISAAQTLLQELLNDPASADPQLTFAIDFPRDPTDPRELSEIPEVRLWFVHLDALYPWLPFWLDWSQELSRYVAMLVPHQFSRSEGIQYNPEALELFVMGKIFAINHWLLHHQLDGQAKLKALTLTLGYELDDTLFELL